MKVKQMLCVLLGHDLITHTPNNHVCFDICQRCGAVTMLTVKAPLTPIREFKAANEN